MTPCAAFRTQPADRLCRSDPRDAPKQATRQRSMSPLGFTQTQFDDVLIAIIRERQQLGAERCRIVARDLHGW